MREVVQTWLQEGGHVLAVLEILLETFGEEKRVFLQRKSMRIFLSNEISEKGRKYSYRAECLPVLNGIDNLDCVVIDHVNVEHRGERVSECATEALTAGKDWSECVL